jgi:prepilin-type N-terminal cleavage/methylation domain-containing protein
VEDKMPNNEESCFQKKSDKAGFTLIEVAVVLVIVGIIISIMSTILPALIQSSKISKCRAIMEKFDYSMEGYIAANGRCPCPDTDGDGLENRNPGSNPPTDDTCDAYVGDLPYLSIGLSSGEDNWHNPITYGVYEDFIKTTPSGLCDSLSSFIQNPDTNWLRTTANGNSTNQAYVLVSGGPKDLDGVNGFFDGLNGSSPNVEFEIPDKIVDANYDDLLRATSFAYLQGKKCGGGGTGGGGNCDGVESVYCGNCDDTIDNDSDGLPDCADTDCATHPECANPVCNIATASPLPSGTINSDYSVTLTASNGCIAPLEWKLLNNGGFNDFYLHPYTGFLSGKLSQCTGSYTITVGLADSDTDNDPDPQKQFTIEVTANLSVAKTSGGGSTTITWDNPDQQETFKANGGHIGEIEWSLNTGGATGFAFVSTGEDTCTIKKDGTTTAGTYTFTLTGIDVDCPGNTANLIFTVTVTEDGSGRPYTEGMEAEWRMDECSWDGTFGEIQDFSGNSLDGTAKNGANTVDSGQICRAGYFDGMDDYLDMGDILDNVFGTSSSSFSVAAWIRPFSLSSSQTNHKTQNCFVAKASDLYNDNFEMGVNTNGTIHVYIDTSGKDKYADFGVAGSINLGSWNFVVLMYDNGSVSVTINGSRYEDTKTWIGGGNIDSATGSIFSIGSSQHNDNYFFGMIDEVMVFSKALTDEEITSLSSLTHTCSETCSTGTAAIYYMDESVWDLGPLDEVNNPYLLATMVQLRTGVGRLIPLTAISKIPCNCQQQLAPRYYRSSDLNLFRRSKNGEVLDEVAG